MTTKISQAPLIACHKILKLRHRRFLTKAGRVRLRYSLSMLTVLSLSLSSAAHSYYNAHEHSEKTNVSKEIKSQNIFELSSIDENEYFDTQNNTSLKDHIGGGLPEIEKILKSKGPVTLNLKIKRGQTVAGLLQKSGITGTQAYKAVKALSEYTDPRKIQPGQELKVRLEPSPTNDKHMVLTDLAMPLNHVKYVTLKGEDNTFKADLHQKEVTTVARAGYTTIQTSLYGSAARSGIPSPIIAEMIRIYSWDIDFQRDIRQGDKIEVMYNVDETEDGNVVKYGKILYAKLSTGGRDVPLYRFEMANGKVDYFDTDGRSIKKTLMKTPVDGARISSGFGMRKHPVLGYNKMHKGMDFAGAVGTPIYAAGDGIIERIGRNGGYGNYIRIRHNNKLKTAYAHMHKFAKTMKKGSRVEQGDVIGYIGSTGRSTGPHLHYEVLVSSKQVNPRSINLPIGEQLAGKELKSFKSLANSYSQQYVTLSKSQKFAQNGGKQGSKKKKS